MREGNIVAIIPVRAGSQRVLNKSIRKFDDTNLLEHKIKQLQSIKYINKIILTTDSDEAKEIGIKYQASAPKSTPIPWFNKHVDTSKKQTALQESESTNYVIGVMSENLDYDALPAI